MHFFLHVFGIGADFCGITLSHSKSYTANSAGDILMHLILLNAVILSLFFVFRIVDFQFTIKTVSQQQKV